jgi:hypothetical protein
MHAHLLMATGCGAKDDNVNLCGGHQIHPTSAGYPRMASAFALSILENFKWKLQSGTSQTWNVESDATKFASSVQVPESDQTHSNGSRACSLQSQENIEFDWRVHSSNNNAEGQVTEIFMFATLSFCAVAKKNESKIYDWKPSTEA